jgi:YidC/Oxa1 family membrane protein insertase
MAGKNVPLAILAGVTQHFQARYALPPVEPRKETATFQEDFARSLQVQMKYVLPIIIIFVAYVASAAVALYWITSNIFAIGQELYVKKQMEIEKAIKIEK